MEELGTPNWVVRGGIATPEQLMAGTSEHRDIPGLTGFSVRRERRRTIDELAAAGRFHNRIVSVTTVEELELAGRQVGYAIRVLPTPRGLFHQTVVVPHPLPYLLAEALSRVFRHLENPARTPR